MLISKDTLEKIKLIIERNYHSLLVNVVGNEVLSEEELDALRHLGFDVDNKDSLLSLLYYNNVLNDLTSTTGPISIPEMKEQQKGKPKGKTYAAAEEHMNENFAQLTEKIRGSVQAGIEGVIRDYNLSYRNKTLGSFDTAEEVENLVRISTVGGVKQSLKDYFGDGNRDWTRVAVTEVANAMGLGSVDRVVAANEGKDLDDVYTYRIAINDAAICTKCRQFYIDADQTPVVYRLSTLLANGTNYGKKMQDWKPVAGINHPNDRETGIMELRPGWRVVVDGKLDFIGVEAWKEYIKIKLRD